MHGHATQLHCQDHEILFSKYGGTDVKIDGEDYLILRQDDVLGVIE